VRFERGDGGIPGFVPERCQFRLEKLRPVERARFQRMAEHTVDNSADQN
jgi:hypothetical protein